MKVKFKKLTPNAVIPTKAHPTDAGFDLVATRRVFDEYGSVTYNTGIAVEIPKGYVGLIFPRSSAYKQDLIVANCVGVIDSGYRGEITAKFRPTLLFTDKNGIGHNDTDYLGTTTEDLSTQEVTFHGRSVDYPDVPENCEPFPPRCYEVGDRIMQMIIIPYPEVEYEEVEELSPSDRGTNGYGSTGR